MKDTLSTIVRINSMPSIMGNMAESQWVLLDHGTLRKC